jgi:hypothetical protein
LIGIVVAYAVAAQSLLIAIGGFSPSAQANAGTPAFTLCLHDTQDVAQDAPALPAKAPDSGCSHCIFCFAGSHQALTRSPPVLSQRIDVAVGEIARVADTHALPRLSAYSIASPRGPPLRA